MRDRRSLAGLIVIFGMGAWAQAPPAGDVPEVRAYESAPPFQIRVETNLVLVRVVVRDTKGRPADGLRKEDFRLFDQGEPQEITGFTVETGAPAAGAEVSGRLGANPAPAIAGGAPAVAVPQRFVALYFDNLHMDVGEIGQTRAAAWRYISTGLRAEDRVAIATSYGPVSIDFTADRDRLHDALFRVAPGPPATTRHECPAIGEYQAYLIDQRQDPGAIGVATAEAVLCTCSPMPTCPDMRPLVRALGAQIWNQVDKRAQDALDVASGIVRRLAVMPGQRSLVLVSPGFLSNTQPRAVEALIDRALRQNVVIHALDAGGLYAEPTYTDTYPGGAQHDLVAAKIALDKEGWAAEADVMADLAGGTGGTFFHNRNDFDEGFLRTAQAPDVYYVLSFSPREVKRDGTFHALKVALQAGDHWDIQARRGYFAATEEKAPTRSAVESLVFSQDEVRGLPATVNALIEKPVGQLSAVNVTVRVDIHDMPFRRDGDRNVNALTFDTALFDQDGKYVTGKESVLDFRLPDARLAALRQSGVSAQISFSVPPGSYRVREIVWDAEAKKMAALNCSVGISAPPAETAALPSPAGRSGKRKEPKKTRSMADWSTAEFLKAMPELKGLEPAQNQDQLAVLLERASQNVKLFFDTLPDTTAHEQIDLEDDVERRKEEFNYLAMRQPGSAVAIMEYRTNAAGKRVQPQPLEYGFVTGGAVSMTIHFHPLYLPESVFRYLGRQNMDGHPAEVVSFAQIAGKARVTQSLRTMDRSVVILVQGVAWIDLASYHIVRMRTELLEPHTDRDLKEETTESQFTEVRFQDVAQTFWLPKEVTVTLNWQDVVYRNRHRYSQFRLFRTDAATNPG